MFSIKKSGQITENPCDVMSVFLIRFFYIRSMVLFFFDGGQNGGQKKWWTSGGQNQNQ